MTNLKAVVDVEPGGNVPETGKRREFNAGLRSARDTILGLGAWTLFPLVAAGLTYLAAYSLKVTALTTVATWVSVKDLQIWPILFVEGVAVAIWGFLNIKYVRAPETKVHQLRKEVSTSILMGYVWIGWLAYMAGGGSVYLVLLIPMIIQGADGLQSALEAINNAAQKMRLDDDTKR